MSRPAIDFKRIQARCLADSLEGYVASTKNYELTPEQKKALEQLVKKADKYLETLVLDGYEYQQFKV